MRTCGECRFFQADEELPIGECRAHPPMIDLIPVYHETNEDLDLGDGDVAIMTAVEQVDVTRRGVWPRVDVDAWCGEFTP